MSTNRIILSFLSFFVFYPCLSSAVSHKVGNGGDYNTIKAAVQAAFDGDEIIVFDGTYAGKDNRNITISGKSLTIRSLNGPEKCIIDCNDIYPNQRQGFSILGSDASDTVINGFTIINACHSSGAAIYCQDCSPVVLNCIIKSNKTFHNGAGIFCDHASPSILDCTFQHNIAEYGHGAAIYCQDSQPTITDCNFISNAASRGHGGAIFCLNSNPLISTCSFNDNNSAGSGGAIFNNNSFPVIENCDIRNNRSDQCGGAIFNVRKSSPVLNNTKIEKNKAKLFADQSGSNENIKINVTSVPAAIEKANKILKAIAGARYYVNGTTGNDNWSGLSTDPNDAPNGPKKTIQKAIDAAGSGDILEIYPGVYFENLTITDKDLTLSSIDPCDSDIVNSTIIDGAGADRVFMFNNSNSVINGISIKHGSLTEYFENGAGICGVESNLSLIRCEIKDNSLNYGAGGGIYSQSGNLFINKCDVSGNSAGGEGGGIEIRNCEASFIDSSLNKNHLQYAASGNGYGGALSIMDSNASLVNCKFIENSVYAWGAGAVVASNYKHSNNVNFINCLFNGNSVDGLSGGYSGAVYSWSSTMYLNFVNCTVTNNTATGEYGGINCTNANLSNCILWNNSDNYGFHESAQITGDNIDINYSCVQGLTGNLGGIGNIGDEPQFEDFNGLDGISGTQDDNLRISIYSPCIDRGDNDSLPPYADTDLDCNPRRIDIPWVVDKGNGSPPLVDMGAYETQIQNAFVINNNEIAVPEGGSTIISVRLAFEPEHQIDVNVVWESGDSDIFICSGTSLYFDCSNYDIPQEIIIAAAEDKDGLNDSAIISIKGSNLPDAFVFVKENENDPVPSIIFVDDDAPGLNNGMDWFDAFNNLQDALSAARNHLQIQKIYVAGGTYFPTDPYGSKVISFEMINGVSLYGGYAGFGHTDPNSRNFTEHETILNGNFKRDDDSNSLEWPPLRFNNSNHIITSWYAGRNTVIDGFTITNAYGYGGKGGGIYIYDGLPLIINCNIKNNQSSDGGAIACINSNPEIYNCLISGNSASNPDYGGCDFGKGGGIYFYQSDSNLINCTLANNAAAGDCWDGGGIYALNSNLKIINSILWRNTILYNPDSEILINYSFIEPQGPVHREGIELPGGIGNIENDPLLTNDFRPGSGSPCIDAGDNLSVPPEIIIDLDNKTRFIDDPFTPDTGKGTPPIVDMGAYEYSL